MCIIGLLQGAFWVNRIYCKYEDKVTVIILLLKFKQAILLQFA